MTLRLLEKLFFKNFEKLFKKTGVLRQIYFSTKKIERQFSYDKFSRQIILMTNQFEFFACKNH